jgi:diguanylate cyclase (GGDEF)-like protein/PAS domain S-box-containing protein
MNYGQDTEACAMAPSRSITSLLAPAIDRATRALAFKDVSIRVKLWLLIVLNSSLALLLAGTGLLVYQRYEQHQQAARELTAQAGVLAEGSAAALTFDDAQAVRETLAALRGDFQVVEAAVYDRRDNIFASYVRGHPAFNFSTSRRPDGVYFASGNLVTFRPIQLKGERIGTIFLRSSTDVNGQFLRFCEIMLLVLIISLCLALLFSSGMQNSIATPIGELSGLVRRITSEKDYSVRALVQSDAEIGILVDSFNEMLSQVESRDRALCESEQRYALAARGANDGLWDWKLTTDEIYFSPRWVQMLGYSEAEIRPDPNEWFRRIHPSDRDRVRSEIAAHRASATNEFSSEYRISHRNGSFIWMLSRGAVVRDERGTAIRMAGSQTDITEGKVADPLTGLPNRLYFLDRLEDSIQKRADSGIAFAVLFLDLDRFKLINDSLGHGAGDELLVGIAGRLTTSVRGVGTESVDHSVVARLGGDEFAILLNGVREKSAAVAVASRILASLSEAFHIAGRQVFGAVSIGIAQGHSGSTPEDLLRNADTAMYHAKAKGKACFEVFDEGMLNRAKSRLEIEMDLHKAVDLKQMVLFYQPQVSLVTRRVTGYEALVRWQHPVRGLVPPSEFISVAEETGFIVPLGRWVLMEACQQMAHWQRALVVDPEMTISVNVSFRQLSDPNLTGEVRDILEKTGLRPRSLRLEMTESIMSNTDMAIDVLEKLKELGVGLEIDDFGTGYSSLSYLSRLPFDTVKIDRCFIKDLHLNGESAEIVKTILTLARSMDMHVVAEGVETCEQLEALTSLGCESGQGYFFSNPVDKEAMQSLMSVYNVPRESFRQPQGPHPAPIGSRMLAMDLVPAGHWNLPELAEQE